METIDELHTFLAQTPPDDLDPTSEDGRRYVIAAEDADNHARGRFSHKPARRVVEDARDGYVHRMAYSMLGALEAGSDPDGPEGGAIIADYLDAVVSDFRDIADQAFSQYLRLDAPGPSPAPAIAHRLSWRTFRDMADELEAVASDYRRAYPAKDGAA